MLEAGRVMKTILCSAAEAYSDVQAVIGQDEGRIDAGELGGRHPEGYLSSWRAPTGSDRWLLQGGRCRA